MADGDGSEESAEGRGSNSLRQRLKALPTKPGIYLMRDKARKVIYIGKAKNLRSRVQSYFRGGDGRVTVRFLVERVTDIETIVTENERQALILESDLIKKYKPRYNVRLKDDKSHFLIRVDLNHEWPKLDLVRHLFDDGARYFGPYAFAYEPRTLLDTIRETIPLRTCADRVLINRVRPCLEYQMKRCPGPCCLPVDRAKYLEYVEQAMALLSGRNEEVVEALERQMERASAELRFEEAAELRDRLDILRRTVEERPIYAFSTGSKDAFGVHREGHNVELSILMVRRGRLFGAKSFGFEGVEIPNEEVLESLLTQFYSGGQEIPEEILIPFELEDLDAREEYYSELRGSKVTVKTVKRGDSARLLELAQENARENFTARFASGVSSPDSVLKAVADELQLEEVPRTIECVDISHFQGGSTVASVVFFKDGEPNKSRYRHFHLQHQEKPDDFASMHEVVTRHLSRCQEEDTVADLMIIDGGRAQLNQALDVRRSLGLTRPMMVGLAKKRTGGRMKDYYSRGRRPFKPERVYVEQGEVPIVLREAGRALHLLERIRDEAHRFAITFHRATRSKRMFRSTLDDVPGLGPRRRKELLRVFGSLKAISEATPEQIVERTSIPLLIAERVIRVLRRKDVNQNPE